MRALSRLGSAVAATALASATVLAGAGMAAAEDAANEPVFDSKSSVSVSGKGKNAKVTYTNNSGKDLECFGNVGPGGLLFELLEEGKKTGKYLDPDGMSEELKERIKKARESGQIANFEGDVESGKTTEFAFWDPGLTDDSFAPAAVALCQSTDGYVEIEVSPGFGVPAGLGSLDAALTGVGSSGSVARTTGSLGS